MAYTGDPTGTNLTNFQAQQLERGLPANRTLAVGRRLKTLRDDVADHETRVLSLEAAQIQTLPADAIGYIGTRTVAQINALGPSAGWVVVAGDSGTPTAGASDALTVGDVAEYDGTQWKKLLDGVGGYVPEDTILVVADEGATLYGPITDVTDNAKIATFSGASNTPTLTVPADGEIRVIKGELGVNENKAYAYDASATKRWVLSSATLSAATPQPVGTAAPGAATTGSKSDHVHAHADQGTVVGSLHDADQVDYERADALKARVLAASDKMESALTDLDNALAPVLARGYRGTRLIAEIDAGLAGLATGDVIVAGDAGTPATGGSDALVAGSVAEYDGAHWQQLLAGSGGFVPVGARLVVSGGALFAPITEGADENKIALFDGTTNTPSLSDPVDGEARVVKGVDATERGKAIVYRAGTGWALQKTAAADVTFADTDGTFVATAVEAAIAEARNTLRTRASVAVTLTAGGELAVSRSSILIDTFGAAASDDVESITGMETGQFAVLGIVAAARNAVIKHVGTIACHGGVDITLDAADDMALVFYDGAKHHVRALNLAALEAVALHAATHVTGGTDVIANAIAAGNSGLMSGADKTKLDGVEALADVTDLTNVSSALGTTAAAAVATTNVGAGDAGKLLKLDGAGKAAGRVLETDGAKLDGIEALADVTDDTNVRAALAAATASIAVNSQKITGLGAPAADTDAATKGYVDGVAQGLRLKGNARVATAAGLDAYTPAGSVLTADGNGALTVDGVAVDNGDRVLVKDEAGADEPYNGWYTVTDKGSIGTPWILTRATDADTAAELAEGSFGWVAEGGTHANERWAVLVAPAVLNTNVVTFTQLGGALSTEAGAALAQNGEALDVQVDGSTIEINADALRVKAGGIADSHLATDAKVGSLAALTTTDKASAVNAINEVDANANTAETNAQTGITNAATAQATANAALPKAGGQMTGNITMAAAETVDGRDLSVDGAKLDGIEAAADVTDATNVAGAGAVMDGDFVANGAMERTGAGAYTSRAIVSSTTGAPDANKLLALDASGSAIGAVSAGGGARWYKATLAFGAFADAALFKTLDVVDLTGLDFIVEDAFFTLGTEFSGGAVGTATLEVGTDVDPDGLVDPLNVFTAAGTGRKGHLEADKGALQPTATAVVGSPAHVPGGGKIQATLRVTGANTDALTAGSVTVYARLAVVAGA